MVPFFAARHVEAAVSPEKALEAVRDAFVAYRRREWSMPPKVYVPAYPAGDFRAMPVLGAGYAALKWVTSFPGNPSRGLPTVSGVVLLSDAANGSLLAVLAAETLGRENAETASVVGAGVNGRAAARTFLARGRAVVLWDVDASRAQAAADELGAQAAESAEEALHADLVVTMTPGHEPLFPAGSLRPGQHVSLMGADGPGKAEIDPLELVRTHMFCDDWEQASHNGELVHAIEAAALAREQVTELGAVLTGESAGRRAPDEVTTFDSTGLAIQDLAIALAAFEAVSEVDPPLVEI